MFEGEARGVLKVERRAAALLAVYALTAAGLLAGGAARIKPYMPLAQAVLATATALAVIRFTPTAGRWLLTLALWLGSGVASQVLAPSWEPPGLSPAIALAMAVAAGLSLGAHSPGVLVLHGIASSLVLLAGLLLGDAPLLRGPGLALAAASAGVAAVGAGGLWGSLALSAAIAYSHIHLGTGWLAIAGLGPSLAAAVLPLIAWERRGLKAWSASLALAALAGSLTPVAPLLGEAAALAVAAGLILYLLEAFGGRVAVASSAGAATASLIAVYVAGLEGRGWVALAGAGLAAGLTLSRFYVELVRAPVEPRVLQGAFLAFMAFSMLFLGISLATSGDCSVAFPVEGIDVEGPMVEVSLPLRAALKPPSLTTLKTSVDGTLEGHIAEVVLRRMVLASVSSPGMVGSAGMYRVDVGEVEPLSPGEAYLLFDFEKPVLVLFAVEDSGGSYILRAAMKVSDLTIPWSLVGGPGYSPSHTFLLVNFTMPLVVESPAGFKLEAYSVVIYPELTPPTGDGVEHTSLGVRMGSAVLGVSAGSLVFSDGTRVAIPASVGEDVYELWRGALELHHSDPHGALLLSAVPQLARADLPPSLDAEVPSEASVEGAGVECKARLAPRGETVAVLEGCRAPPKIQGLSACIAQPKPPEAILPTGQGFDPLKAALARSAATPGGGRLIGLAALLLGGDGATAWAALYLDVLELDEARLSGSMHPYYVLGMLAPFIASAGFTIYSIHSRPKARR